MNQFAEKTKRFRKNCLDQLDAINAKLEPLERKFLHAAFFDKMARVKYSDSEGKDVTLRFVETTAVWEDKWRVSLPQLKAHLEAAFSPAERKRSRLCKVLQGNASLSGSPGVQVNGDPFFYELDPHATSEEYPMILLCRYVSLFEATRKRLLRDRRDFYPDDESHSNPFYTFYEDKTFLVFPGDFYKSLIYSCVDNLCDYLQEKGRVPEFAG